MYKPTPKALFLKFSQKLSAYTRVYTVVIAVDFVHSGNERHSTEKDKTKKYFKYSNDRSTNQLENITQCSGVNTVLTWFSGSCCVEVDPICVA